MSIQILPAQLANQIAAGEVVERPASVVKELVENSLDAGATAIKIDIEKGGAKRIRISDNGSGIAKEQLTLALSRHATSKIKNLTDLEGIASLGFRGEALASISSVARLTLTSKPAEQESAWQAMAHGRDMAVEVQPAAHGNGTTIDVLDLFFNTPARRKFLRTEKTEFSHIDEVIKRIALARFDVAFTLTHNGKIIRQYRLADNEAKQRKRVAQVCGQSFIDNALEVCCQHDGLSLHGWVAKPSFNRGQNDLCYSYVNGRMMRDKLINHAIRQAYQERLPNDTYPAFVLFLSLDVREVDVNVHPAKHEVRFHQGRYVHDFIYTVCHQAIEQNAQQQKHLSGQSEYIEPIDYQAQSHQAIVAAEQQVQDYVQPLKQRYDAALGQSHRGPVHVQNRPSSVAASSYQALMTPYAQEIPSEQTQLGVQFLAPHYGIYVDNNSVKLVDLLPLNIQEQQQKIEQQWPQGLTSQPLLLPVKLNFSSEQVCFIKQHLDYWQQLGIHIQVLNNRAIQVREFPALLRDQDVSQSFEQMLAELTKRAEQNQLSADDWRQVFAARLAAKSLSQANVDRLLNQLEQGSKDGFFDYLRLNSVDIDLKSSIQQLATSTI